jgi:hypothetical protein
MTRFADARGAVVEIVIVVVPTVVTVRRDRRACRSPEHPAPAAAARWPAELGFELVHAIECATSH